MARKPLTVGIAQVPVLMGDKCANVRTILAHAELAAKRRCDVVVFPECSLVGWSSPAARRAAETIPGPLTRKLGGVAKKRRMAIVIGLEERDGKKIHNSAVLIDKTGAIIAHHRKVNELDFMRRTYICGTSLGVADFAGRTVAVDICADSWDPEITDGLWGLGARLIFSPCAWAVEPGGAATNLHWIGETYRARTRGRDLVIVAANSVGTVTQGPWKGRILQGASLVYGPDGRRRLKGPTNCEALLMMKLS